MKFSGRMTNITKPRISIRLTPNQELVLREMSETLGTSISMLIRTIVGDWLKQHEEQIYRIIDKKKYGHALDTETRKEEDIFSEEGD